MRDMIWQSCAEWPPGTILGQEDQVTKDVNGSKDSAQGVADMLRRDGFGGDKQIFPLRTWVEPAPLKSDHPDIVAYLEMARLALALIPDYLEDKMDLSDDELIRLRDHLQLRLGDES